MISTAQSFTTEKARASANQDHGAVEYKTLALGLTEHSQASLQIDIPAKEHLYTPFDTPLPDRSARKYWINSNTGLNYALYSLVHVGRDDMSEILESVRFHGKHDVPEWHHRVIRAPIHDFCSNNKTLRDVFDYHCTLSEDGSRAVVPGKFVLLVHADWENEGVLVVDFDCDPDDRGTFGILRTDATALPHALLLLEQTNHNWRLLKAAELGVHWKSPIAGYTGTSWHKMGLR